MPKRLIPILVAYEHPGSELTPEEVEFGKAMEEYKRKYGRRFPAWSEVLFVLRSLGYRREDERAERDFRQRLARAQSRLQARPED